MPSADFTRTEAAVSYRLDTQPSTKTRRSGYTQLPPTNACISNPRVYFAYVLLKHVCDNTRTLLRYTRAHAWATRFCNITSALISELNPPICCTYSKVALFWIRGCLDLSRICLNLLYLAIICFKMFLIHS